MIIIGIILILSIAYLVLKIRIQHLHKRTMLETFEHRIHVNGIRGKSSVTRLVSATMREGGIKTLGKTTGTAARILVSHTEDAIVPRKEADIAEQKRILNMHRGAGFKAVVFECMAINPIYQKYLENKIMMSTIGVITNVREDHVDLLGETLPEIARSLCSTVPMNGHLVTAELDPELLKVMEEECEKRGSTLHAVGDMPVKDREMSPFKHFEYKSNVAIALKIAELVGIKRRTALKGMYQALPDPGAFILKKVPKEKKTIHWANLFAINDRESFVYTTGELCNKVSKKSKRAVILNNRHDRPERVAQFVDIAINNVKADYIITFGDYEKQVVREIARHTEKTEHKATVLHLGNSSEHKDADGETLFEKITEIIEEKECLLFGAVNIHTPQSVALLGLLEESYAH